MQTPAIGLFSVIFLLLVVVGSLQTPAIGLFSVIFNFFCWLLLVCLVCFCLFVGCYWLCLLFVGCYWLCFVGCYCCVCYWLCLLVVIGCFCCLFLLVYEAVGSNNQMHFAVALLLLLETCGYTSDNTDNNHDDNDDNDDKNSNMKSNIVLAFWFLGLDCLCS